MNQIKRKIKKKPSPQQALKSKRFVVVTVVVTAVGDVRT